MVASSSGTRDDPRDDPWGDVSHARGDGDVPTCVDGKSTGRRLRPKIRCCLVERPPVATGGPAQMAVRQTHPERGRTTSASKVPGKLRRGIGLRPHMTV